MSQATISAPAEAIVSGPVRAKLNPQTAITIAVDTEYVASQQGQNISQGIYMFDNQLNAGSTGEGTLELFTQTADESLIGFNVVPMNPNTGDQVIISGFTVSQGSIWGSQGYPEAEPSFGSQPAGSYWIGQATSEGPRQTYQIQIKVTTGGLRPATYYVNWDPFIAAS
ncbi:MAG TPA: hypothetical protein VF527_21915 [Pyrinomonadaceae bacterium]|jgi:hypothetical protein